MKFLYPLIITLISVAGCSSQSHQMLKPENNQDLTTCAELFEKVEWDTQNDISWKKIFDVIKHIPVTDEYTLEWKPIQYEKLVEFLVEKQEFSEERVRSKLDKLHENKEKLSQTGLGSFM